MLGLATHLRASAPFRRTGLARLLRQNAAIQLNLTNCTEDTRFMRNAPSQAPRGGLEPPTNRLTAGRSAY